MNISLDPLKIETRGERVFLSWKDLRTRPIRCSYYLPELDYWIQSNDIAIRKVIEKIPKEMQKKYLTSIFESALGYAVSTYKE